MLMMITYSMMMMLITISLLLIWMMLMKKSSFNREKSSPFECGFDPKESGRFPFSIHFFMVGIIFLIFDVEIVLILPLLMVMKFSSMQSLIPTTFFLIMILLWGLIHEWNYKTLNWTN
nr:NADH dehydrogenase subunit 3 [Peloridium hammoniorum]